MAEAVTNSRQLSIRSKSLLHKHPHLPRLTVVPTSLLLDEGSIGVVEALALVDGEGSRLDSIEGGYSLEEDFAAVEEEVHLRPHSLHKALEKRIPCQRISFTR